MAGAAIYWTVALSVGLPSLGRALGTDHHRPRRMRAVDCVESQLLDGRAVAFGDCISVRFVNDSPEIPRPVLQRGGGRFGHDGVGVDGDRGPAPEDRDPIGRTAY
jgi:hypothetical protein